MPKVKQPPKVQLAVRISQDVHRAAKAVASVEGIPLAAFVEDVLLRALLKESKVIKVRRINAKFVGKSQSRGFPVLEVRPWVKESRTSRRRKT